MKKILVVSGNSYARAIKTLGAFSESIENFMKSPKDYDLVMFTGGADVSPELYGDTSPQGICYNSPGRDKVEQEIFALALKNGIKMTGICRGSQFINVMSGGRMMHDVRNHAGSMHKLLSHASDEVLVNSYHHQMSVPSEKGHIIGWSKHRLSGRYIGKNDQEEDYTGLEVEAIYYPHTKCAGAQWHPEMMNPDTDGYIWYFDMVDDFMTCSPEAFSAKYVGNAKEMAAE